VIQATTGSHIDRRWIILLCLFLGRTALGVQFQSLVSVSDQVAGELGLSFAELGTLIGFMFLPGLVLAFPTGWLARWMSDRTAVTLGLLLIAGGGAVAAGSSDFDGIATGRALTGVGFVICSLYFTKMVADWFAGRELAAAMGMLTMSWPAGIAISQVTHGAIGEAYGWQTAVWTATAYGLVAATVVWIGYRAPARLADAPSPSAQMCLTGREWWLTAMAALAWAGFNAGYAVYLTFAPQVLIADGLDAVSATARVSLASWMMMASLPLGGIVADRTGRPDTVLFVSMSIAVAALIVLPNVPLTLGAAVAFGLIGMAPAGVIMALTGRAMAPERRAFGMAVFYSAMYPITALAPIGGGWLYDLTGEVTTPLLLGIGLFTMTAATYAAFRLLERRWA
jgi:predicted MFS family arabinose efflux permease